MAGDVARAEGTPYTDTKHVLQAKKMTRSVEQQLPTDTLRDGKTTAYSDPAEMRSAESTAWRQWQTLELYCL